MVNSALTIEGRLRPRYELNVELQFSYQRGECTYHGTGRTRDLSDHTICFESDQEVPGGVQLELCMPWPVSLQGLFPLDVIIHGALDFRVPDAQGLGMFTSLQRRGVPSRYVWFPDEGHWILQAANRVVWWHEVSAWLDRFLKH